MLARNFKVGTLFFAFAAGIFGFFCYDNAPGVPDTCQYQAISYWLFTLFCTFAPLLAL